MEKLALALSLIGVGFLALMLLLRRFFLSPDDVEYEEDITWEHAASREREVASPDKADNIDQAA